MRLREQVFWALVTAVFFFVGLFGIASLYFYTQMNYAYNTSRLERRLQRGFQPSELQRWATNLIAQYPPGPIRLSVLGTNIPNVLLKAYRQPPHILLQDARRSSDTHVRVIWGSGFMGHWELKLGFTNFEGSGTMWAPGIYFWTESSVP